MPEESRLLSEYLLKNEEITCLYYEDTTSISLHTHDFFEVCLIVEGRGKHQYGNLLYDIKEDDIIAGNPRIPHGYQIDTPVFKVLNVLFTPDALRRELTDLPVALAIRLFEVSGVNYSGLVLSSEIKGLIQAMYREYKEKGFGYQAVLRGYLLALVLRLYRVGFSDTVEREPTVTTHQLVKIEKAINLIAESYDQPLKIPELAAQCGWSPDHFTRMFTKVTGQPVISYLRRVRMGHAAVLLMNTSQTIEDIAEQVGYANARSFRRAFQKVFGLSPWEYRHLHRNRVEQISDCSPD